MCPAIASPISADLKHREYATYYSNRWFAVFYDP